MTMTMSWWWWWRFGRVRVYIILIELICLVNLVPGEPQEFRAVRVTSNSIDLEWKAPKRDEQSASSNNIKGYEIHYFKVLFFIFFLKNIFPYYLIVILELKR